MNLSIMVYYPNIVSDISAYIIDNEYFKITVNNLIPN